jgi:hypothetical protein
MNRPVEAVSELELMQLLDNFFYRAIYYAAPGCEKSQSEMEIASATTIVQGGRPG